MATDVRMLEQLAPEVANWTPEWQDAQVFPVRYPCTEEQYLAVDDNVFLEFADGFLEVLPSPTFQHQRILSFLLMALHDWVVARQRGLALFGPLRVRVREGRYREPDVLFMLAEHADRMGNDYWEGADLVMEVVSERNRRHDLVTKREEYARAGIPEYWIVDPEEETITVFVLGPRRKTYAEHRVFRKGERAASMLLPGFSVDVTETFNQKP
jgi:Uma2 family endonuclease